MTDGIALRTLHAATTMVAFSPISAPKEQGISVSSSGRTRWPSLRDSPGVDDRQLPVLTVEVHHELELGEPLPHSWFEDSSLLLDKESQKT